MLKSAFPHWNSPPTHMQAQHGPSKRGFTLLEVLTCLMLVAIVLPVAIRAIGQSTRGGSYARSLTLATNLADTKLAEVVAEQSWTSGDDSGDFTDEDYGDDADRFAWTLQVDDWIDTTARQLTLTVTWEQMGKDHVVALSTAVMVENY